jgi:DNA-binding transcriptional regulator LsrR (DeoR family)
MLARVLDEPIADVLAALQDHDAMHRGIVPRLCVFDADMRPGMPDAIKEQARRFGKAASGRIVELLAGARVTGVAWGRTLNNLVDALAAVMPRTPRRFVQFIPICAELVALDDPDFSSS